MATLLRSLRYVRRLTAAGAAQRLGAPALRRAELLNSRQLVQCFAGTITGNRNYVTEAVLARQEDTMDQNALVDNLLNELDMKVRQLQMLSIRDIEKILNAINNKGFVSSNQALLLIRSCGTLLSIENSKLRENMIDTVWKNMEALNVTFDVSHYNALLLVHLENETDFSPLDILVEMKEKNIDPNRVTFQRLIEQYCNKGNIAGATKILEYMRKEEIPINENIFNCLIKGHSEAGDVFNAIKILNIMKHAGIAPTANSYTAVLCVHAKRGDIDAIRSTLNECSQNDFVLLDKDILEVIYTLACNGHEIHIDEMMSLLNKGSTYNRDIKFHILRLVERNQIGVAYKLLKSMAESKFQNGVNNIGNFFIKKLVVCNTDVDVIANYCKLLNEEKLNDYSFETALFIVYSNNMHHYALPLLKACNENQRQIRKQYFYPLFVTFGKENNLEGILNTMKTMIVDYQIIPSVTTVTDYIIPFMKENPFSNIKRLVDNNLPFSIAAHSLVFGLLKNHNSRETAKLILSTKMRYNNSIIHKLVESFVINQDATSICEIVHHQCIHSSKNSDNTDKNVDDNKYPSINDFANLTLGRILNEISVDNLHSVESILEGFFNKGIRIHIDVAAKVREYLPDIKPEIENILNQLTSETLQLQAMNNISNLITNKIPTSNERDIKKLEEKASESSEFKMILAREHVRNRNREVAENLIQEMKHDNVKFNLGFCLSMIEFYSRSNNSASNADEWYKVIKEMYPSCKINKVILLDYATSLVYAHRITDAWKILEHPILDVDSDRSILSGKLLKVVYQNYPDDVIKTFRILCERGFILQVKSNTAAYTIKVHLEQGNIEEAIKQFKLLYIQHKILPMKKEILIKLIENKDITALQNMTDFLSHCQGQSSALILLALSFLEVGRQRQARKILETPNLRFNFNLVMWNAKKYYEKNRTDKLENLIQLFTGLNVDMSDFYMLLLKSYDNQGKWEKCLSLWTQMQEDNIQPSAAFMSELQRILSSYNQPAPFADPVEYNRMLRDLHEAFTKDDLQKAEKIIPKIPNEVQQTYSLKLLEKYMDKGDLKEVTQRLHYLLEGQIYYFTPAYNNFIASLFTKLIDNNDFNETLKILYQIRYKKKNKQSNSFLSLTQMLNETVLKAGKFEEFLNAMKEFVKDDDKKKLGKLIHDITFVTAMQKNPVLLEKFKEFALEVKELGVYAPINVYWIYLFIENTLDAENFWQEHLKDLSVYHSTSAILACEANQCWEKIPLLAEKLTTFTGLTLEEKRKNFVLMLNTLIKSDEPKKYEIAFECLQHAVKVISLKKLSNNVNLIQMNLPNGKALVESLETKEDERKIESESG